MRAKKVHVNRRAGPSPASSSIKVSGYRRETDAAVGGMRSALTASRLPLLAAGIQSRPAHGAAKKKKIKNQFNYFTRRRTGWGPASFRCAP